MPEIRPEAIPRIGLYRSGITDPVRLLKTSIGRDQLLDDMLDKLRQRGSKKSGINHLYIGPRGIGKTHLLSLLEYSIHKDDALESSYTVIRFPEESNRILSFADFLLGIIEILEAYQPDSEWSALYQQLQTEEDDALIIDTILPRLKQYHQQSGQNLLIMLENLDTVLMQQIKSKKDIHRLRSFIMDNAHIILVATAPVFFPALNDIKHPLYDFFDIEVLDSLSQEQTLDLIKQQLHWDKKPQLLEQFAQLQPKILALHEMTSGNPRLIMMLYGLIHQGSLNDVKNSFHALLDTITPFYQDRIKDLPPQERALLETLALMRNPYELRTPVNIAKRLRKSAQQISTLLKRMTDAGYLSVVQNPDDKRSRIYRIKEGFFDIWLAMNESRGQRKYLPYLVEFFSRWYADKQQREAKRQQLAEKLDASIAGQEQQDTLEQLAYLSETGDAKERSQTKLALAVQQVKECKPEQSLAMLQELKDSTLLIDANPAFIWMRDQTRNWANGEPLEPDIRQRMETMIECWSQQRIGELETANRLIQELSLDLSGSGLHKLNVAILKEQLQCVDDPQQQLSLYWKIVRSQKMDGLLDDALITLNQALDLSRQNNNQSGEGTTLNDISQIYHARGDYETALDYLKQSLAIVQEIGDKSGEGTTLNNISTIYHARGDNETALNYLKQSLAIKQEIGNKSGEGITLNNISQIYHARADYEIALDYLKQSLVIFQEIGDKPNEGTTLNNISQIYSARSNYEAALDYLKQSLAIFQEIGDKSNEGTALNNISQIYHVRGDYETALDYLNQSLAIRQEIGDTAGLCATLFNMGHIHLQNEQMTEALQTWLTVYNMAKKMQLAQVLDALEKLAGHIDLEDGLNGWEQLEKTMGEQDKDDALRR
jgi:tetratricopeptide (TPR) repeat protein